MKCNLNVSGFLAEEKCNAFVALTIDPVALGVTLISRANKLRHRIPDGFQTKIYDTLSLF